MTFNFPALYTDHLLILMLILVLSAGWKRLISVPQILFTAFTTSVAWLTGSFLKYYYWLPRPFMLTGQTPRINFGTDGSFPSNHAILAFTLALSVWVFHRRLGWLLLLVAVGIGTGRVQAGVHTIWDICGAFVLSVVWIMLSRKYLYRDFSN